MLRKYEVSIERTKTIHAVTTTKMVVRAGSRGEAEELVINALDDNEKNLLWYMSIGKDCTVRRVFKITKTLEIDKFKDKGN